MASAALSNASRGRLAAFPLLEDRLVRAAFEAHPDGLFALGPGCTLLGANRAAREMLARGDCARVVAGRFDAGSATRSLRQRLAEVIRSQRGTGELALAIHTAGSFSFRLVPLGRAIDAAMLVAREQPGLAPARAIAHFGFTEAEWRVAVRVARGLSPRATAQELGVKIDTVRSHLKQVFVKVGVHRQAELVAQLLSR